MGRLTRTRGGRFAPSTEEALASIDDVSLVIGDLRERIAVLEATVGEIRQSVAKAEASMEKTAAAIAELRDLANMGRGGWVVLVKQGAIISALIGAGAAISALWQRIA